MADSIEKIIDKVSGYEILNGIIPGAVYVYFINRITPFSIVADDICVSLILYYFIGTIISRIGSLIIEPLINKKVVYRTGTKVTYSPYEDYVKAETKDSAGRIKAVSSLNNMYRSFESLGICVLVTYMFSVVWQGIGVTEFVIRLLAVVGLLSLVLLFALSSKKQTRYLTKRVQELRKTDGEQK